MKKLFAVWATAALAALGTAHLAPAHIGYTNRNLGTWTNSGGTWGVTGNSGSLAGGNVSITLTNISSNFGWADATDADWGDSHKGRWFTFTLQGPGSFVLSATGGGSNSTTMAGVFPHQSGPRFLPGLTVYRGLAVSSAHDGSDVSVAYRGTLGFATEGSLNALGTFSIGNDSGQIGELAYVGHVADGSPSNYGPAAGINGDGAADGRVSSTFHLAAGTYSVFLGGADYNGADPNNYGAQISFGAVPEPSAAAFLLAAAGLLCAARFLRRGAGGPPVRLARNSKNGGAAFTLVELLVVLAIVGILASIGITSARAVAEGGNSAKCLGNLKGIGTAALAYAAENGMKLPMTSHNGAGKEWEESLKPYAGGSVDFRCPSDRSTERTRSYAVNDMLTPNPCQAAFLDFSWLSKIERPSETIYFAEAAPGFATDHFHFSEFFGGQVPPEAFAEFIDVGRHGDKANYLFADGHAEALTWNEVRRRLENPADRITDPTR